MKVSLNTLKQYLDFELPPLDELVARINAQLGGIENVEDLKEKYGSAKIVRVVECEKHASADRLTVCKIDVGDDELVNVVCGANNVRKDMWAIWLPPGSIVPKSYGTKDEFKLSAKELRGEMSNGMLASGDEMAISNDHDGIIEISTDDLSDGKELKAGQSFAEVFGLDDTLIDIENKMFTHRPDLFGHIGIAREVAGIFNQQFTEPDWYIDTPTFEQAEGPELRVFNEITDKVPRFSALMLGDVKVGPSPLWLQCALTAMGSKSINNVVDITNYVMLITSQPTHAYDYDKLAGSTLGARMGNAGETVTLLNGKTYELSNEDIVIADGNGPVGLAGIMGGSNSEVSDSTTTVVLESAVFDMYAVRRSSMRYGLFTPAVTRFNKGQSPLQTLRAMRMMVDMMKQHASARVVGTISDIIDDSINPSMQSLHGSLEVSLDFINQRLGLELTSDNVMQILNNVHFETQSDNENLKITAPFWRTDISLPEDIVEEVGRLYGFDKLPKILPRTSIEPAQLNSKLSVKQLIRSSLASAGANEVLSYSFVHENTMKKAGQDSSQAFRLSNALSPDLQFYRLSVLPSLLEKVHPNIKSGHDEFALFEIGKGHNKKYHSDDDNGLPKELEFVDLVYASKSNKQGAPYFMARRFLDHIGHDLGLDLLYKEIDEPLDFPVTAPFDQSRSALVETRDGTFIGMVGELSQSARENFKLPQYSSAITLDLEGLVSAHKSRVTNYVPVSRFPSVTQDVSIVVPYDTDYREVYEQALSIISSNADSLDFKLSPISIYRANEDADSKTITLRLKISHHDKSLTDAEVANILDKVIEAF